MSRLRTHYDNLKVARDAPVEVIDAAYRVLAQKYHPDRNPDGDAARIMAVINTAYQVLSNPDQRRKHDDWIKGTENGRSLNVPDAGQSLPLARNAIRALDRRLSNLFTARLWRWGMLGLTVTLLAILGFINFVDGRKSSQPLVDSKASADVQQSAGPEKKSDALRDKLEEAPVLNTASQASGSTLEKAVNRQNRKKEEWEVASVEPIAGVSPGFSAPEQSLLATGPIWLKWNPRDEWPELAIKTGAVTGNVYVKVLAIGTNAEVARLFVRRNERGLISLPPGMYKIRYASGEAWYGEKFLFGPETAAFESINEIKLWSEDNSDGLDLHGQEVELIPQPGGNFPKRRIALRDF